MKRQRFTHFFAAAVFSLTMVLLSGCTSIPATPQAEAEDIRTELVEWARLAQNAHNVQPWRVVLDDDDPKRMALYVDTSRLLPETDPPSRQITISMGTFLAVLEARAAQLGYGADISLFPLGQYDESTIGDLPVALINLDEVGEEAAASYPIAGDIDAISRATVKYRYRPAQITPEELATIEQYSTESVTVTVIGEPEEVVWLDEISVDAFALEMATEATLMETYDLTRMNGRQRRATPYGLSLTANFPVRTLWFIDAFQTVFAQDPEAFGNTGVGMFASAMEDVSHYILMVSSDNSRTTQVETGRILQAVWMELHAMDHVALPNSQALQEYPEMRELYDRIHQRYAGEGETVQMLLAVARPQGGRHRWGPRIPTAQLISSGEM